MVPARPVADGRWEIGPCREGPERVHPPEARRPDHPSAGCQAVHRASALGEIHTLEVLRHKCSHGLFSFSRSFSSHRTLSGSRVRQLDEGECFAKMVVEMGEKAAEFRAKGYLAIGLVYSLKATDGRCPSKSDRGLGWYYNIRGYSHGPCSVQTKPK